MVFDRALSFDLFLSTPSEYPLQLLPGDNWISCKAHKIRYIHRTQNKNKNVMPWFNLLNVYDTLTDLLWGYRKWKSLWANYASAFHSMKCWLRICCYQPGCDSREPKYYSQKYTLFFCNLMQCILPESYVPEMGRACTTNFHTVMWSEGRGRGIW